MEADKICFQSFCKCRRNVFLIQSDKNKSFRLRKKHDLTESVSHENCLSPSLSLLEWLNGFESSQEQMNCWLQQMLQVHPGETPSQFVALGFLQFILSPDPRAAILRSRPADPWFQMMIAELRCQVFLQIHVGTLALLCPT